jgi:CheY-specific phosphatase CheX
LEIEAILKMARQKQSNKEKDELNEEIEGIIQELGNFIDIEFITSKQKKLLQNILKELQKEKT